jgi:hypothetical protein
MARLLKDADCQNLQINREFIGDFASPLGVCHANMHHSFPMHW